MTEQTITQQAVPFLDLAAQQAEVMDDVLPVWQRQLTDAAFIGGAEVAAFERRPQVVLEVVGILETDADPQERPLRGPGRRGRAGPPPT